ncbi:MAG: glyoxalase [Bacteroidota bacterium]|nr:glyoxalase [Bacteroidota bacterium]
MHIDHTTIRTSKLEQTKDFFLKVFDIKVGSRPARIAANILGYWLYFDDAPLIHLIQSYPDGRPVKESASEAIDHTGFSMEGYDAFKDKLDSLGILYSPMDLPEIGERRLFFYTPTGILLETVFREPVINQSEKG